MTEVNLTNKELTSSSIPTGSKVTKLILDNAQLSSLSFLSSPSSNFSISLTFLNLSNNSSLTNWSSLSSLPSLSVLNASNCSLSSFPQSITSLTTLKALVLSHNNLSQLPSSISSLTNLNTLVISHNTLTSLPPTLSSLLSLVKLSASHNLLSSSSLSTLNLSPLPSLRQLRLNDNKSLTSLPDHFGTWGKGKDARNKLGKGLELLELGNCGFQDWNSLRTIAAHDAITNFSLKGTPIEDEAIAEVGLLEFRRKLLILLPALRILDSTRFDAKHQDLKRKRDSRDAVQKIVDAGPMARVINEQSENPLALPPPVELVDKRRKRIRLDSLKEKRERGEAGAVGEDADQDQDAKEEKVMDEGKNKKRVEGIKWKGKKREESHNKEEEGKEAGRKSKRKKQDHPSAPKSPSEQPIPSTSSSTPVPLPPTSTTNTEPPQSVITPSDAPKPRKKRGRESKFLGTIRTPEERALAAKVHADKLAKLERDRKLSGGGLLDELKGDGSAVKVKEVEKEKVKEKEKTSVVKVVVVDKKKDKKDDESVLQLLKGGTSGVAALLGGGGGEGDDDGGYVRKGWY